MESSVSSLTDPAGTRRCNNVGFWLYFGRDFGSDHWLTIWLSACEIHISDCECDKLMYVASYMCMKYFIFAGL